MHTRIFMHTAPENLHIPRHFYQENRSRMMIMMHPLMLMWSHHIFIVLFLPQGRVPGPDVMFLYDGATCELFHMCIIIESLFQRSSSFSNCKLFHNVRFLFFFSSRMWTLQRHSHNCLSLASSSQISGVIRFQHLDSVISFTSPSLLAKANDFLYMFLNPDMDPELGVEI
jgi:hypothetical protein